MDRAAINQDRSIAETMWFKTHRAGLFLLPNIEQSAAYAQYDFNQTSSLSNPYKMPIAGDTSVNPNVAVTSMILPALVCPSDDDGGEISSKAITNQRNAYSRENARRASYGFNTGSMTDYSGPYTSYNRDIRQGSLRQQRCGQVVADQRRDNKHNYAWRIMGRQSKDIGRLRPVGTHWNAYLLSPLHTINQRYSTEPCNAD